MEVNIFLEWSLRSLSEQFIAVLGDDNWVRPPLWGVLPRDKDAVINLL